MSPAIVDAYGQYGYLPCVPRPCEPKETTMRRLPAFACILTLLILTACSSDSDVENKCSAESTYEVVNAVFANRGCTASTCHGADESSAAGGLDLRPETLYENTVNIAAASSTLPLVFPADEERSVLYLKVAAKTTGTSLADFGVAGGSMPSTDDALTEDELGLLRAWIRGGAPIRVNDFETLRSRV